MFNKNENETYDGYTSNKKPIIAIVIAAVLVLAVGVTAFAARDKIGNVFKNAVTSPEDYYHSVEKDNFKESLDAYMENYSETYKLLKSDSIDTNGSVKVELADDVSTLLATVYPALADLKSAEITYDMGMEKEALSFDLGAKINDANIISGNMYLDSANSLFYAQVPEISESYLNLSSEMSSDEFGEVATLFSSMTSIYEGYPEPKTIETIIEDYVNLVIDSTKNITKDTLTVKANGVEQKATALTVKMSGTEVYDLLTTILDTAEKDEDLKSVISKYIDSMNAVFTEGDFENLSVEDFETAIADAKTSLEDIKEDMVACENVLTMIVYVDSDGNIIGRDITIQDDVDKITLVSKKAISKNQMGYEMVVKQNDDKLFNIKGYGSASLTNFAGEFVLTVPSEDITVTAKVDKCDVSKYLSGEFKGEITLTTDYETLSAYELKLTIDSTSKTAAIKAEISGSGTNYGSLSLSANVSDKVNSKKPADSATLVDITDEAGLMSYIGDFNPETFINDAAASAGLNITYTDLVTLFSSLGGSSYEEDYDLDDYTF